MLQIHRQLLPKLPDRAERYGLVDQIRRSSKSVGVNIAEGHGRFYYGDNICFCYNARGSLVRVALDLKYCSKELYDDFRKQSEEIRRMLNGYTAWLKKKKTGAKEPGANLYTKELSLEYYTEESTSTLRLK